MNYLNSEHIAFICMVLGLERTKSWDKDSLRKNQIASRKYSKGVIYLNCDNWNYLYTLKLCWPCSKNNYLEDWVKIKFNPEMFEYVDRGIVRELLGEMLLKLIRDKINRLR